MPATDRSPVVAEASAVRALADGSGASLALIDALVSTGLWPALVPSAVLADCLTGDGDEDRAVDRLLPCLNLVNEISPAIARQAAWLRTAAGRGSANDALVVALAEPGGVVLVGERAASVEALALQADAVYVERI